MGLLSAEVLETFVQRALAGDAEAQYALGNHYLASADPGNLQIAVSYFQLAANQGHTRAENRLGHLLLDRVPPDNKAAAELLLRASKKGNLNALATLAFMYETGCGVTEDVEKAVEMYADAANQGCAISQFNLGSMYEHGRGVQKNEATAVRWYRSAERLGDIDALNNLGGMIKDGRGVEEKNEEKNYKEALSLFQRAKDRNHADATFNLGLMNELGFGTAPNDSVAIELYKRAITLGNRSAQTRLNIIQVRDIHKGLVEFKEYLRPLATYAYAAEVYKAGVTLLNVLRAALDKYIDNRKITMESRVAKTFFRAKYEAAINQAIPYFDFGQDWIPYLCSLVNKNLCADSIELGVFALNISETPSAAAATPMDTDSFNAHP